MISEKKLILFDGVCNLCNGVVQFVIKRDRKNQFQFASLQSNTGREILRKFNLPVNTFNSFILVEGEIAYTKSTGALRVAKQLGGGWPVLYGLIIVPKIIRNGIYNLVARNRYKWFGKKEACVLPTPEFKAKFLD